MKTIFIKALSEKKGGVLVFFAFSLIALTAMAGLALDAAHLYGVKSQLQVAADAAALAGANAMTGSSATAMRTSATTAATTVAAANYADIYPSGGANAGEPMPVTLISGDVICGIWDGTTFAPNGTTAMNAVEVIAKRTGAAGQPMVQNGLIRVLSLLGATGFNETGVVARAVACRTKLAFAPVAVNEYLNNSYPHSYMRGTDVDGSTGWAGTTFAFFGEAANNNNTPLNTNGFVDLDYRSPLYNGTGTSWYGVTSGSGTCSDPLTGPTAAPNNGAVNSVKNTYKGYLNGSIPDGMVPANAVREPNIPLSVYNTSGQVGYYVPALNSQPPYATLPHFSVGGNLSGVNWTVGQQLIVMVYDGITQGSGYDFVTVVGYGVVQVDTLGPPTWTGHAIPHGPMAGQDDPYIIQPSLANPTPSCSDTALMLQQLEQNFPVAKLVDSSGADMHYGMAPGH
jgi:hypothetical protein